MNEQIKQLSGQAKDWADNQNFYESHYQDYMMERFAKLIVREMLKTCDEHPAWSGNFIGEQIKEHFGVESHYGVVPTDVSKHFGVEE